MKKIDYRKTKYYSGASDITNQKNKLLKKIKKEHPRIKILYNQVKKKDGEYNKLFRAIYNNRCAYCGITMDIISSELFEIDHFICESSFNGDSESAGNLKNLVLSCKKCNREKKDYTWKEEYTSKFNVDDDSIVDLFYRDKDYYIKVEKKYLMDATICNFYKKLKFDEEIRRLDFLLLNMYGFYKKYKLDYKLEKMLNCILLLQQKRNKL